MHAAGITSMQQRHKDGEGGLSESVVRYAVFFLPQTNTMHSQTMPCVCPVHLLIGHFSALHDRLEDTFVVYH